MMVDLSLSQKFMKDTGQEPSPLTFSPVPSLSMPTSSIKKPNTLVLVTRNLSQNELVFMDILRVRGEALYLIASNARIEDVQQHVEQAKVFSLETFLSREEQKNYDLLYIPGYEPNRDIEAALAANISELFGNGLDVVAVGTGRLLLARSGLLKHRLASSASLDLTEDYSGGIMAWMKDEIICDGCFWTANDTPDTIHSLACLYKAERKGDRIADFPLSTFRSYRRGGRESALTEHQPSQPSAAPGADLVAELLDLQPTDVDSVPEPVLLLAIRLGVEGFVDACNSVVLTLLSVFPNALAGLAHVYVKSLEYIWLAAGVRPAIPWGPPSREDLDSWAQDERDSRRFPAEDDREDILESIKTRITLEGVDWMLPPYTLAGAIAMALDAGQRDQAREWMKTLAHEIIGSELPTLWRQLACWRNVAELAVAERTVTEITSRTSELAKQDAELVNQALISFSATSATAQSRRREAEENFVDAPMSTLVPVLDTLKWESHDTLLKPPASSAAIREAEDRLGIELPEDYKQFLLVSNGIEFMPLINTPGFRPVEELKWQDAEELGLDDFRVDLGCKTDPAEYERLPKMGRVLVISDNSEEQVWYVDLDTVVEAIRILKTEGRSDDLVGEPGLRVVFWANYLPDLEWLKSFRRYMEGLARKADEVSAR